MFTQEELYLINQLVIQEREQITRSCEYSSDDFGIKFDEETQAKFMEMQAPYLKQLGDLHEKLMRGGETHADDDSGSHKKASEVVQSGR